MWLIACATVRETHFTNELKWNIASYNLGIFLQVLWLKRRIPSTIMGNICRSLSAQQQRANVSKIGILQQTHY